MLTSSTIQESCVAIARPMLDRLKREFNNIKTHYLGDLPNFAQTNRMERATRWKLENRVSEERKSKSHKHINI